MRIHGYCTSCRKPKPVRVSGHGMAMLAARRIPQGICASCEERQNSSRRRKGT